MHRREIENGGAFDEACRIDIMKEETKFPVLLLDDVLSELDDSRRIFADSIEGIQALITSTEKVLQGTAINRHFSMEMDRKRNERAPLAKDSIR